MGPTRRWQAVLGVVLASLVLAGCPDDDDGPASTTTVPAAVTTLGGSASTTAPTATTVASTPTTAAPVPTPPPVTGLTASTGGGSGETVITWPPLPASAGVASYQLYKRKADGTELAPATVTSATLGIEPGRLGIVDAPDTGPWATMEPDPGPRCYKVSAVSSGGVEGPVSPEACASPVGG